MKYLKMMRVHHWTKNMLVFLPLIFSEQLFQFDQMLLCVYAFLAFSLLSSAVYIFNDIMDVENDRQHSIKCKRPIASGEVSIKQAWITTVILSVMTIAVTIFALPLNSFCWVFLVIHLVFNVAYSAGLKNHPIIDVVILASGFVIRTLFGSLVTGIVTSNWLYLTVLSMSFYLVFGKRRNEKRQQKEDTRKVLKLYSYEFLDKFMHLFLGLTITFYSLWTIGFPTNPGTTSNLLVWTVPLVVIICMKYSLNLEGNSEGDPVDVILSDKLLLGLIGLYVLIIMGIIYL